jgi:Immunity protein 10
MTTLIVARVASFMRDDAAEVLIAGFAEFADGSGRALLFQVATYEPEAQDVRGGMDTYCITNSDGSAVEYGGLRQAQLVGNELSLLFTPETARAFGIDDEVKVSFEVDESVLREFKDGFPQVVLVPWGRADQVPTLSGF